MNILTDGLIIREQVIGEQDKLVTILTSELGVIRAFVRGGKNIKKTKSAATQLLCYSQLKLYKGKNAYSVDDASVKEMFVRLRTDAAVMAYAQYFCELAQRLCPQEQPAKDCLSLILNGIYLLANKKKNPMIVKACVEMRLLCLAGYAPDLMMCRECGVYENDGMLFFPQKGFLVCPDCLRKNPIAGGIPMSLGVLKALRHTVFVEPERLFSFSLSEDGLKAFNKITEEYLLFCVEKDFATLQFLKLITD